MTLDALLYTYRFARLTNRGIAVLQVLIRHMDFNP